MLPTEIILDTISDGFVVLDAAWCYTYVNRQAETLLRRTSAQLLGKSMWDVFPELQASPATHEIRRAAHDQTRVRCEVFYASLYVWHELYVVPYGNKTAIFLRDVTERQRLLRGEAERAYLRNVVAQLPVAITITRGPDHRIELVNAVARQLSGGRELEGKLASEAFPELHEQGFIALLDQVYATGVVHQGRETLVRFDWDGDGEPEIGYFDFTYQPIFDFDGRVSGIMSVSINVTEQVKSRQAADQLALERATILAQVAEGVIVTDSDGRITFVNPAAERLHGHLQLDVLPDDYTASYNLLQLDGSAYPPAELPLARAVLHNELVQGAVWRIRRPDQSEVVVQGTATPLYREDGSKLGAVLTMHEIAAP